MDLKIIGPIKSPLKEFDSVDEFNIYYHKHKDEMDTETTHSLNKKYYYYYYYYARLHCVLRTTCMPSLRAVIAFVHVRLTFGLWPWLAFPHFGSLIFFNEARRVIYLSCALSLSCRELHFERFLELCP